MLVLSPVWYISVHCEAVATARVADVEAEARDNQLRFGRPIGELPTQRK